MSTLLKTTIGFWVFAWPNNEHYLKGFGECENFGRTYATAKLQELNVVASTSTVMIAFAAAAYGWAVFATSSYIAKSSFAAAMVLCLTAFCKANQQIRFLHRSILISNGEEIIKAQLGSPILLPGGRFKPSRIKCTVWQMSVILNHMGQIALFVGLAVTLTGPAFGNTCALRWECADTKVLALLLPVSAVAGLCYYGSNVVMYSSLPKKE